jgi:hypothetical protein
MSQTDGPETRLSVDDAFAAMHEFLKLYIGELKDANVADVLSDPMPAYGGKSADPGSWPMWLHAVDLVQVRH